MNGFNDKYGSMDSMTIMDGWMEQGRLGVWTDDRNSWMDFFLIGYKVKFRIKNPV